MDVAVWTDMESLGKPLHRASAPVEMVEFAFNGGGAMPAQCQQSLCQQQ
eukprot:gene11736-13860_t